MPDQPGQTTSDRRAASSTEQGGSRCLGQISFVLRQCVPALLNLALQVYGVFYYFVLFAVEIIIWWIPYAFTPHGFWRRIYNIALVLGTLNFEPGDTLNRWLAVHERVHRGTLTVLPHRSGRIVPNLEHMLLHAWTLLTALATFAAVYAPS